MQLRSRIIGKCVVDPTPSSTGGHKASFSKHFEVITQQVRCYRNDVLQIAHTRLAMTEPFQHNPADRVTRSLQKFHARINMTQIRRSALSSHFKSD